MKTNKTLILNNEQIDQKINRIAYQIFEDNYSENEIIVVGIASKGYLFAKKLVDKLNDISSFKITLSKLTLDKENPLLANIDIDKSNFNNKVVILVDDVLNSGRTLIFGVKYLLDFPLKNMSTVVLVDRNNKRYPIGTHYVGLSLSTTLQNHIYVEFDNNKVEAFLD